VGNGARRQHTAANGSGADVQATNTYLDWLNQRIADEIQASGFAFIMTSTIQGRTVLRLSICSHRTTLDDIEAVFNKLSLIGAELDQAALAKQDAAAKRSVEIY
jgi:hypothetical protein